MLKPVMFRPGRPRFSTNGHDRHYNWNGLRSSFESLGSGGASRDNYVNIASHKLSCKFGQNIDAVVRPLPLYLDCSSLYTAQFTQSVNECLGSN
jgi:hypothetical protein